MLLPLHMLNLLETPAAATASLSGTVYPTVREDHLRTGGMTVEIAITGDQWVAAGATFDAQRQNIIDGFIATTSQDDGWNNQFGPGIPLNAVERISDELVTITLDANFDYWIDANEEVEVTVPASALDGGVALPAGSFDIVWISEDSGSSDPSKYQETVWARRDKLRMEDEELLTVVATIVERIYEFAE